MVCSNCSQETNGIKINKKLFCTNCGEAIYAAEIPATAVASSQAPATPPIPTAISRDGSKKTEKDIQKEIDLLGAEEKVIELLDKKKAIPKPKTKVGKKSIVKHNRERTEHKKEKDFMMVYNEPDPIAEPELVSPHDDQIESSKGPEFDVKEEDIKIDLSAINDEEKYPLVDRKKLADINEKKKRHHEILASFLKSGASQASQKKHKKADTKRKLMITAYILIPVIIVSALVGLVFYVNLYGNKAEPAVKKAESAVGFSYTSPQYVPLGYALTYLTTGDANAINYDYQYGSEKAKRLNIYISKTTLTRESIFKEFLVPKGEPYTQETRGEAEYWLLSDSALYFVSNNLLYEIISSDKMPSEELTKIADGLL
jgi:hypothetical protein